MQKCILTIGISASGKTTWTKEFCRTNSNFVNLNRDDLRFSLFGFSSNADYKFSKEREKTVTSMQFAMGLNAISSGKSIIISDTNLNEKTRTKWKDFCQEHSVKYSEEIFHVDVETCQERNALRANGVPPSIIYKQWQQFNDQFGVKYLQDTDLPPAIIVDIDGTLAHMKSKRKPYDWDKVYLDEVDEEIQNYLNRLHGDVRVIFLSGRDSVCREMTEYWLDFYIDDYEALYMRPEKDYRKDTIIKKELFDNHIRGKYNVLHVIDDRPCVVNMWNDMGLKVWAVSDQRIQF